MTEYINLEIPRNIKKDDQKGNVCMQPLPHLLLPTLPLLLPHYSIFNFGEARHKSNTLCESTLSKEGI